MDKNFEELELRAYENDAEAQYELAVYYKNKQNNKSYVDWLKKSAKLNNSNAKVELAELYLQGVLIDKDEDLAISLLEEELEVNKNARLVLGKYYVNTRDEENIKKGLDLLLSIAGENAKATYEIGMSLCFLDDDAAKLWALNLDYNYKQNDNGELPDEFTKLDFNTIVKEDFKSKDMQYAGVRLLDKAWNMGEKRAAFALATLLSNEQGFALTNKGILYTDEQNEISMLDYNSIISFEVTRKFLSTKLMVVTSEGKIIELKNDFASDKMDDAVIYIKAMIKEIMASDIYIGESPVMVSNVTAPNNDMTKADNVTAESTDKVSDLRAGLNSNELPALLKQYFSTHAEPEKAMASSKLKAGLSLPSDCEVYYAQDATLLGSGKNGFAITSKGVYTRKMFEKNVIIKPLDVFKTGKQFSTDKSTPGLLLDGQFFVECLSGDKLVPLFNGLVEYLDKAKAENSAVSESDNSATKYCPNCGTALRGQAKFCSKCGYKL